MSEPKIGLQPRPLSALEDLQFCSEVEGVKQEVQAAIHQKLRCTMFCTTCTRRQLLRQFTFTNPTPATATFCGRRRSLSDARKQLIKLWLGTDSRLEGTHSSSEYDTSTLAATCPVSLRQLERYLSYVLEGTPAWTDQECHVKTNLMHRLSSETKFAAS
jgi:hypothetical protein